MKSFNRLGALLAVFAPVCVTGAGAQGRIPPRPVQPPAAYQAALSNGTRGTDGRPGARYWQQRADYTIAASLDESGVLTGSETIAYQNNSPDTLTRVLLHLDQNVFKEGARRNRRVPITGGFHLTRVAVDGLPAEHGHPGSRYYQSLTLLEVRLTQPLPPGGGLEIALDWSHRIPPAPTFRNGNLNGAVFAVAQWYPRVAVYDDVYGWNDAPYLGDGEFYLEYGDFDVALTVPTGWLIGATGTLENAEQAVGTDAATRLAAAGESTTDVVRVAEGSRGQTGTSTWRFAAEDVRDFAFSTSPDYVWDAVSAGDGVLAQALYRPHLDAWAEAARYTAHTITTFSEALGAYIYPQLTMTEGPVGGMEYPMLVLNPSTNNPRSLASVTIHEGGHQWFPMMVGSMEAKHAWMDEGFISYWQEESKAALWGEEPFPWGANASYLGVAGTESEVPLMRHTDLVSPFGERTLAAYRKPAVVLGALRSVLGDEVFLAAFRDYFESWKLKHPQPWDFFATLERHAGQDLDWFWRPIFFETDVLDHGITGVSVEDGETRIEITDEGDVILPARLAVTLADGSVERREVSASRWIEEGRVIEVTVRGAAVSIVLDEDVEFPDVDRTDNRWTAR